MRLSELIMHLDDLRDEFGDEDPEVRFAHQPSYPLQDDIGHVYAWRPEADRDEPGCRGDRPVAYIVTGGQCRHPYAPREVFES
jgi:hypothetical protein